jgi:hypothetical protein
MKRTLVVLAPDPPDVQKIEYWQRRWMREAPDNLETIIRLNKISLVDLAKSLNVHRDTIEKWIKRERVPDAIMATRIARYVYDSDSWPLRLLLPQ